MRLCYIRFTIIVIHLYNDEYLIYLYRQGNDWALELLYQKYIPIMLRGILTNNKELENLVYDKSECLSKCYLSLFQCIDYYCEHKNVSFGAYAYLSIMYEIRNYGRKIVTPKMQLLSYDALHTGEASLEINDFYGDPQRVMNYQLYVEKLKQIQKSTKGVERAVVTCMIAGYTSKEIIQMLSYESKTVSNAIYRVRKKMKKVGKEL